jgi:hypothetical protein
VPNTEFDQLGIQNLWLAGVQQVPIAAPWRHPFLQRAGVHSVGRGVSEWAPYSLEGQDVPRPDISPRSHDDHFVTPRPCEGQLK